MINANKQNSINLQGQRSLLSRTSWRSVAEPLTTMFRNLTPMPVLSLTPMTTPLFSHNAVSWLSYPVASAGCVYRPQPRGAGSFKLQLRRKRRLSCLPQFVSRRSCNLKERYSLIRTPMPVLLVSLLWATPLNSSSPLLPYPVASAGFC